MGKMEDKELVMARRAGYTMGKHTEEDEGEERNVARRAGYTMVKRLEEEEDEQGGGGGGVGGRSGDNPGKHTVEKPTRERHLFEDFEELGLSLDDFAHRDS